MVGFVLCGALSAGALPAAAIEGTEPKAATESATPHASGDSHDRFEAHERSAPPQRFDLPQRSAAEGQKMDAARPETAATVIAPSHFASAEWKGIQVVVYKAKRLLAVYRDGRFEREFRVVLGLVPAGRKRHANDARTPEGLYRVTGKRRHDKWQHFLALDYPTARDRERYESDVRRGAIPDDDGKPFGIGGDIGIHGNDREKDQQAGVDWTKGCIALSAADIEEVSALVPVGALVWIVE